MASLAIVVPLLLAAASNPLAPHRLRVEYLDAPITIDMPQPRFSFALAHPHGRGEYQTSYRIVVRRRLLPNASTVWVPLAFDPARRNLLSLESICARCCAVANTRARTRTTQHTAQQHNNTQPHRHTNTHLYSNPLGVLKKGSGLLGSR